MLPARLALVSAAVLCAVGSGAAPRAATGTSPEQPIRGRVELRQPPGGLAPRPHVGDVSMPRAHDPTDRRRSVVYLETAPRAAFDQRVEPRARMDQRNEAFVPHVLAIVAGTTVDFPNNDKTYHNVFSLSPTKPFDLGRYAVGRSKSVRFDRPGIVRVFCDIHSHMSAFILVFAHRTSRDDDDGQCGSTMPAGHAPSWPGTVGLQSGHPRLAGGVEASFALGRR
jgi:plastocyanin